MKDHRQTLNFGRFRQKAVWKQKALSFCASRAREIVIERQFSSQHMSSVVVPVAFPITDPMCNRHSIMTFFNEFSKLTYFRKGTKSNPLSGRSLTISFDSILEFVSFGFNPECFQGDQC
jgi:hypothetical protein